MINNNITPNLILEDRNAVARIECRLSLEDQSKPSLDASEGPEREICSACLTERFKPVVEGTVARYRLSLLDTEAEIA